MYFMFLSFIIISKSSVNISQGTQAGAGRRRHVSEPASLRARLALRNSDDEK
jgi:hypothetical protein